MSKPNDYDPARKWIIEVTERQLYDIIEDVEDIHRFISGQMELMSATDCVTISNYRHELRDKLRELQPLMTPDLELGESYDWAGNGCPNVGQREKIKCSYAIYRNLLYCLTKFRAPEHWTVYQSETLTCGVPLAICYPKPNDDESKRNTDNQ